MRLRAGITDLSLLVVVILTVERRFTLQFFFLCASVVSYDEFFALFVPYIAFYWYLGKALFRHCGISRVPSHIFLMSACSEIDAITHKAQQIFHSRMQFHTFFRE